MKILFIRFSSIGDIVLTTPVIRCVKQQIKDAEVHFLLKKSYSPVLENNPYIDRRFYFEDSITDIIETLREENYDLVIDLQKNFRSLRIKQLLGVKSFSFNKLNIQKWILVNFKINLLPETHIVDRYMNSVGSLGVTNDGLGLDYFVTLADEEAINRLPESHRNKYIAWVIGARHFTKRLPIEKMIPIAKEINSPIVLLGDKADFPLGELLCKEVGKNIYNACGAFSLNESAALVKRSLRVISNDTGLMHIAAALKKDIISFWGNTIPGFGMSPYYGATNNVKNTIAASPESIILEVNNLSCRPCSKIGFEKCPRGHFKCMLEIKEDVFNKL